MTIKYRCGNCAHWNENGFCYLHQKWTRGSNDTCDQHKDGVPEGPGGKE